MSTGPEWASDPGTPPDGRAWDLVVLGGGTAGIVAARTAAGFGASVLLVERGRTGGDCLWTGCVPSKTLLASAHAAATMRSEHFGVHAAAVEVDFGAVMGRVHRVISMIGVADSPQTLRAAGVRLVHAEAHFRGPRAVALDDGAEVAFRHALIATGSRPALPPIAGLDTAGALTSDDIWGLDQLPASLIVLGGGSIGCELAQAFARLGSRICLVEAADRLLPREDPAAGALVRTALEADGVEVRLASSAVRAARGDGPRGGPGDDPGDDPVSVTLTDGSVATATHLLVAVGRRPQTEELSLPAAAVALDAHGFVLVDARLRTTNPRIWAAGDVTGHPQFTHVAGVHGSLAASNAVLGLHRKVDTATIPRVTYTHPEVAAFGAGAAPGHRVVELDHREVDRAVSEEETLGVTRLVLDRRRRIMGATIVGARAGELIGELVVAARAGLRVDRLAGTMHAYPGYADAIWKPAIAEVRYRLQRPAASRLTRQLMRWQRRRAGAGPGSR